MLIVARQAPVLSVATSGSARSRTFRSRALLVSNSCQFIGPSSPPMWTLVGRASVARRTRLADDRRGERRQRLLPLGRAQGRPGRETADRPPAAGAGRPAA